MPTTQPLDEDDLGDIGEGQLRPIAAFAAAPGVTATQPQARSFTPSSIPKTSTPETSPSKSASVVESPAPKGGRMTFRGITTIDLSSANDNKKSVRSEPAPQSVEKSPDIKSNNAPYTEKDVLAAWDAFIDANGQEHLLVNAMRVARPASDSDNIFTISGSKVHLSYISENLYRLTDFIRNDIGNDKITFRLQEVSEDSPLAWNDRELLGHIIENNPGMKDFIEGLDLKLL